MMHWSDETSYICINSIYIAALTIVRVEGFVKNYLRPYEVLTKAMTNHFCWHHFSALIEIYLLINMPQSRAFVIYNRVRGQCGPFRHVYRATEWFDSGCVYDSPSGRKWLCKMAGRISSASNYIVRESG